MLYVLGLDSSQAAPKVPWTNKATGLVLLMVSAADQALSFSVTGLCSLPVVPIQASWLGWARNYTQQWASLRLSLPAQHRGRRVSRGGKALVSMFKIRQFFTYEMKFPGQMVPLSWLCR